MSVRKRNNSFSDVRKPPKVDVDEYMEQVEIPCNIKGDEKNISVLLFLYILQGIPLGLMQAVPIIIMKSGVSYKQQAAFSLVNWPFSMKLLWAPIVDSWYSTRFGRRKSWLIPTQYLIGLLMLFMSFHVEDWLNINQQFGIATLTGAFFLLNFLAATQDIAVDGWALTMLQRHNVGYASTCNSVGQTAGYFLGYVAFIALESAEFCNSYLRSVPSTQGIITLPGFLVFWGWVFIVTTTLIAILKSENEEPRAPSEELNIFESYESLWQLTKLEPLRILIFVLLTIKIGFSACDSVTGLKLIESGIPKEKLALLAIPLMPLQILLPLLMSKYTAGPRPMDVFMKAVPYRLLCGFVIAMFVWVTPLLVQGSIVPWYYYVLLLVIYSVHQVTVYSMFVAQMAFFAKISDPAVGGTYMTFLNTLANLGGNWPQTVALYLVDSLTLKQCSNDDSNLCTDSFFTEKCVRNNGKCATVLDGYYVETVICTVFGILWILGGKSKLEKLQNYSLKAYKLKGSVKKR